MQKLFTKKKFIFWLILFLIAPIIWILIDLSITKIFYKIEIQNIFPRIPSNIFHHTLNKNVNVVEENGRFGQTRLITNSIGFRDKEVRKIAKETSKYRIVFIGDSFTEGILLNYEETFIGIIDKKLSNYNIEVLNAGVVSYSPSIYYAKIKYFLEKNFKFDELIVYIDISDIEDEAKKDLLKIAKKYDSDKLIIYNSKFIVFLKKNFVISYTLLNFISDKTSYYLNSLNNYNEKKENEFILSIVSGKTHKTEIWTINKELYSKYQNGVKKSLKYMKLLKDLCDKNNIKLTIAVYPRFTQIYHNDLDSIQVKIWNKFSQENSINFINYFPHFIANGLSLEQRMKVIKKYFIPFDHHHNKEGAQLIAHIFLEKFIFPLIN